MGAWRDAVAEEAGEVHRLLRGLAAYERLEHEFRATEGDIAQAMASGAIHAMLHGTVAVCVVTRTFSTFAGRAGLWIEDIFVEPAHRRQGIATAAFAAVARRALAEGAAFVEWNVLDWNAPAIAAYRAMGAAARDGWTDMRLSGDALTRLAEGSA